MSLVAVLALAGCAMHGPARPQAEADDRAGAGAANLWYTPGRVIVCGSSVVLAGVVMIATLGYSYESASELMHGGCSEPWSVSPQDVRNSVP
jgi:hypothetical protein